MTKNSSRRKTSPGGRADEINTFIEKADMIAKGARGRKTKRQTLAILKLVFGAVFLFGLAALVVFWVAPMGKNFYDQKIAPVLAARATTAPQNTTCTPLSVVNNGTQFDTRPTLGRNYCATDIPSYQALISVSDLGAFATDIYNGSTNKMMTVEQIQQALQNSLSNGQLVLAPSQQAVPTTQPTVAQPTPQPTVSPTTAPPTPTPVVFATPSDKDRGRTLEEIAQAMNSLKIPSMQGSVAEVSNGLWTLHYQNAGVDDYYRLNLVNLASELSMPNLPPALQKCVAPSAYDTVTTLTLSILPVDSSIQIDYGQGNIVWAVCK